MDVHITGLIVQKRQAGEDSQIVCFFWTISTENLFVIPLPFGCLFPCHGAGLGPGRNCVPLDPRINALNVPFLDS